MADKTDEAKIVLLRRAHPSEPAELVISHDGKDSIIYVLRESQLRQLARESVALALAANPNNSAP